DPQHETDGSETGGIEAGATVEEQDISTGPTDPNPTLSLLRTTAVVDTWGGGIELRLQAILRDSFDVTLPDGHILVLQGHSR
ncbi:MAG TPA: hypothetical protein VGS08_01615, partial [Candidatus Saccharimonadales bacterium]|nr:hypothetical protein [Candidatus Saccharimonadales bacterium]